VEITLQVAVAVVAIKQLTILIVQVQVAVEPLLHTDNPLIKVTAAQAVAAPAAKASVILVAAVEQVVLL
jgi:hypothetical protein